MSIVIDWYGREIDFESAVALMDDDIRDELVEELEPFTEQRFFNAYLEQHYADYGEEFTILLEKYYTMRKRRIFRKIRH